MTNSHFIKLSILTVFRKFCCFGLIFEAFPSYNKQQIVFHK